MTGFESLELLIPKTTEIGILKFWIIVLLDPGASKPVQAPSSKKMFQQVGPLFSYSNVF